jgi:hypothetical protein
MAKGPTLLIGPSGAGWHAWLQDHRRGRDLIVLDPSDAHYGPAARLRLLKGTKTTDSVFYGSLDPQRAPHLIVAAASWLMGRADEAPLVQAFPYRPSPLLRQTLIELAFLLRPAAILIARGTPIDMDGWPIGPDVLDLPTGLPALVVEAQRKAQWLKMIELGQRHEVPLKSTSIQGVRLGSGSLLEEGLLQRMGLEAAHRVEVCGSTLLVIADRDPEEHLLTRALDHTHASRAVVVHPNDYENLLCAFVRPNGECFGYGRLEGIDFHAGIVTALTDAVPPVPVPILRIGSLRVDGNGRELGDVKPWTV